MLSVANPQCLMCQSEGAGKQSAYEGGGMRGRVQVPEHIQKMILKTWHTHKCLLTMMWSLHRPQFQRIYVVKMLRQYFKIILITCTNAHITSCGAYSNN